MLKRLNRAADSSKTEISYRSTATQVESEGKNFTADELPQCEQDEVVPWESPSMQAPLCSWSSFPIEPSQNLKLLVDFFTPPNQ